MDKKMKPIADNGVFGKVPPQNLKMEEAVLGICMLEHDAFPTANQYLFSAVFYKESHQKIYEAFGRLFDENKPIDILTVAQKLRESGQIDKIGGEYAIVSLTNSVTSSAHLEDWCKILLEFYMKREGITLAADLQRECYSEESDAFDLFNKADHEIINLQEKVLRGQIADINTFTRNVYEQYETVKQTGVLGIKTGIEPIDRVMCGLVSPDLIIIAARPGSGKTSLAMSITKNITYEQDIAGAWFSLEMDGTQLTRRLVSMVTGINHSEIRHGTIPPHLETEFYKALDNISKKPLFIEDKANINIRDMRARAIVLKRKYNIQYIIVDYIQLMNGVDVKNKNRNDIVGEISRGLKQMAKELNIPVIGLAQLSRAVESRSDKIPQLSDLRESGSIEQDADSVLFLMRPEYYGLVNEYAIDNVEYSTRGLCLGIVGKNRHGETKNIPMEFIGSTMEIRTHTSGMQMAALPAPKNNFTQHNIQNARNVLGEKSGDFDDGFSAAELF